MILTIYKPLKTFTDGRTKNNRDVLHVRCMEKQLVFVRCMHIVGENTSVKKIKLSCIFKIMKK